MSLLNSPQNSTGYIQTGGFSPCTLFPDLLPPKPLADLLTIYSHIMIKLCCLHRTPFSAVVCRRQRWMRRPTPAADLASVAPPAALAPPPCGA
jgi:hypothetical protein